jgi:hypothetical protein
MGFAGIAGCSTGLGRFLLLLFGMERQTLLRKAIRPGPARCRILIGVSLTDVPSASIRL